MTEHEPHRDSVKMLHRMIAYIRDEAVRLRIMDVAVLLEHAEKAAAVFSPEPLGSNTRSPRQDCSRVDH